MFLSSMCRRSPHAAHHAGTRFGRLRIVLTMCRVVHFGCHRHRYLVEPRVVLVLDFDFDFGLDFHWWHRPSPTAGGGLAISDDASPHRQFSRGSPRSLSGHSVTPFFLLSTFLLYDSWKILRDARFVRWGPSLSLEVDSICIYVMSRRMVCR